jgi:2-polyprenyl-3-methyl-5-hydroxy-6-metoxy-1,4-benzoquinol methylase
MNCKICSQITENIFSKKVLMKYDVSYFRCSRCFFIQTEEPYWLEEAYQLGAIGALDVGIISRNWMSVNKTKIILKKLWANFDDFCAVDFGGGNGMFVRMMRDLGFKFYLQDLYAENLYARYFQITDLPLNTKYNILTAFEVLEHLPNPVEEIKKMFNLSDILLFSTELQPSNEISEIEKWWYIVPEGGQHISFYNKLTFQQIESLLNVNYYTDNNNLHILSKNVLSKNPFGNKKKKITNRNIILERFIYKIANKFNYRYSKLMNDDKPKSLTMVDFEFIKQKITNHGN